MRRLLKELLIYLLRRSIRSLDQAREEYTKQLLGSCGARVSIRQPTVIEVPSRVHVGDDVSIASFVHMWGNAGIRIGARAMIASHVAISTGTHDPDSERMWASLIELPISIGDDVWIGAHAVIFPGVTIGARAVVGAGAIVLHDVAPGAVVVGVPARAIRSERMPKGGGAEPGHTQESLS